MNNIHILLESFSSNKLGEKPSIIEPNDNKRH